MAEPTKIDPLSVALEKRLDELFHEDEPGVDAAGFEKAEDSPLAELKKIVFSIDWEITPEALDSFLDQILLLREVYRDDKVVALLLQMLGALGQYIQSSRSRAHPSTFGVLNSVFARLEEIVNTPELSASRRSSLLQAEVDSFQQLRAKIMQRRAVRPAVAAVAAAGSAAEDISAAGGPVTPEMLARVAAELKEMIRSEMQALRQLLTSVLRR